MQATFHRSRPTESCPCCRAQTCRTPCRGRECITASVTEVTQKSHNFSVLTQNICHNVKGSSSGKCRSSRVQIVAYFCNFPLLMAFRIPTKRLNPDRLGSLDVWL